MTMSFVNLMFWHGLAATENTRFVRQHSVNKKISKFRRAGKNLIKG
jgi:hypothetical protein